MRYQSLALCSLVILAGCVYDAAPESEDVGAAESPVVTGVLPSTLRVAVVPYNFADNRSRPLTRAQIQDFVFNGTGSNPATASLRSYWAEVTGGRMNLTGDVYDWVELPFSQFDPVDGRLVVVSDQLLPSIDPLAGAQGFLRSNYDVVIYTTPYAIQGVYMGGDVIVAELMNRRDAFGYYAHELGHFLGLSHANTLTCGAPGYYTSVGPSSVCVPGEYNDETSFMGRGTNLRHPSAFEKLATGIWTASQVQDVTATGTYQLPALERGDVSGTRVLRIPLTRRPYANQALAGYYYLSYRQPTGFDASLAGTSWVSGLAVHFNVDYTQSWPASSGGRAYRYFASPLLLDATPATGGVFGDGAVLTGQTFRDPTEGVSIRLVSANSLAATVEINLDCRARRVVSSSRVPTSGTTAPMVADANETTGLITGYDNWQYVQIDTGAGCEMDVGAVRRKMSPGASVPYPNRSYQGEGLQYSLTGAGFSWVDNNQTTGWEPYVAYSGHAWHTVGYGWSSWLRMTTPVRARYIRYLWDGDGPSEVMNEVEMY